MLRRRRIELLWNIYDDIKRWVTLKQRSCKNQTWIAIFYNSYDGILKIVSGSNIFILVYMDPLVISLLKKIKFFISLKKIFLKISHRGF